MSEIIDRLAAHRVLAGLPRAELEWLARHGEVRRFEAGQLVMAKGAPIEEMVVQFSGRVLSRVDRASGRRDSLETRGGDVTALLPFSRMGPAPGPTYALDEVEALAVHRDEFPEMIRECPALIERLVHLMLDRTRHYSSSTLRDEQLQSLGRFASGLAHELNNPASAAARSSKRLREALPDVSTAAAAFGAAPLTPEQRAAVADIRARGVASADAAPSPMQVVEREEEIARWLDAHGVDVRLAEALAESALSVELLERLVASVGRAQLGLVLHAITADLTVAALAREVEEATDRIHRLVSAVKGFTQLDKAVAPGPMNVAQGLADTVTMLASKARAKSVTVELDLAQDLPPVMAGDDLNQVWLHLIDNALDAVHVAGEVRVEAVVDPDELVVRIRDNGPGIPPEIAPRIFDPFFTTKPPGQGTGLGLDVVRRVLAVNQGHVAVDSEPGRTEFRVSMPLAAGRVTARV